MEEQEKPTVLAPSLSIENDGVGDDAWDDLDYEEKQQILDHREKFASYAYGITQAWFGLLFVVIIAQICLSPMKIGLKTPEFITVVTTTTTAVFGFAYLVGKFLFPSDGSTKISNTKRQ